MNNEKKLWLCEQYAQKAWTLSLVLAQEAARAGGHGKGYAVIAQEARILADKLFEYAASVRFDRNGTDFKGLADFAFMLKLLSINSAIEINRVAETNMEFNIPKSMSVFAEEMRRLAGNINELADKSVWDKPYTIPEMATPSGSNAVGRFFKYTISGHTLIENINIIVEVLYRRRNEIEGKTFNPRGSELPVINCYQRFNIPYENKDSEYQTIMIICPDGNVYGNKYAIPIDELDINAIFYSRNGTAVSPKQENAFAEYVRECWDAVGSDQLIFADWAKMIAEK